MAPPTPFRPPQPSMDTTEYGKALESAIQASDKFNGEPDLLDFTGLEPQAKKVRYKGKLYWLVEMSEAAHLRHQAHQLNGATLVDGKIQADMSNSAEGSTVLLQQCLYHADPNTGDLRLNRAEEPDRQHLVNLEFLRGWPHHVLRKLFDELAEMSKLHDTDSVEFLERRIAADTKKLASLRRHASNGHDDESEDGEGNARPSVASGGST